MRLRRRQDRPALANAVTLCCACHRHAGDVVLELAGERRAYCSTDCLIRDLQSPSPKEPTPDAPAVGLV